MNSQQAHSVRLRTSGTGRQGGRRRFIAAAVIALAAPAAIWSAESGALCVHNTFRSRLQRALQIPAGIIDNARGGASVESLVPRHKFKDHPLAARYLEWVDKRRAEFDWDAAMKPLIEKSKKEAAERCEFRRLEEAKRGTEIVKQREMPGKKKTVKQLKQDFRKLKFGMFICYNMATYKGVEWVAGYHTPSDFDPGVDTIDTDAWADAAVSAGMKYGVLTAKHVAGFCLWDSRYTDYDVMNPACPYKKDIISQFIESFKSRGLKVGLYYCWRHPGFGDPKKFKVLPPECDPATHSLKEQIEFQKAQIAELIEKYPDVFYLFNDALDPRIMPADEILTHIRSIRRDVIASSNWWNWGKKGTPYADIAVKELRHFPETNTEPGETCWKLEQKWFWKKGFRAGSAQSMVDHMAKAESRNSNFLLNTGPDKNGNIGKSSIKTLAEIGKLLKAKRNN